MVGQAEPMAPQILFRAEVAVVVGALHKSPSVWPAVRAERVQPQEVAAVEMRAVLQSQPIMGLVAAAAARVAMGAALAVSVAMAALAEMHLSCSTTKLTELTELTDHETIFGHEPAHL